jgi:hypothetical protein
MPVGLYSVNLHLDRVLGSGDPATVYVAVMDEPGGYLFSGSDLSEPTGGGYARVAVTNDENWWPDAADGYKTNGLDIIFPQATGVWGVMKFFAIMTTSGVGTGEILYWGGSSARLVTEGSQLRFPIDTLSITAR